MFPEPWPKANSKDLARYVTPYECEWLKVPGDAPALLQESGGHFKLVRQIYLALVREEFTYAIEPREADSRVQQIRTVADICQSRHGTCLDLALFFAGVCIAYGLLPMVVVLKGHAFVAVSLDHARSEANGVARRQADGEWVRDGQLKDEETLRTLLESGRWVAIECTGFVKVTSLPRNRPEGRGRRKGRMTFPSACRAGAAHLTDKGRRELDFAIDVGWLHDKGIRPAQTRHGLLRRFGESLHRSLIQALRERFVGRRTILKQIEDSLTTAEGPRHSIVEAPAGFGKSALMAELIARHPEYVHHFVRADDQHHTATSLLRNLCHQLSEYLGGGARVSMGTDLTGLEFEFERLKSLVAETRSPGRPLVIVVDGLDESAIGMESVLKPSYFLSTDQRLRFVLSLRSGSIDIPLELSLSSFAHFMLPAFVSDDVVELFDMLGRRDLAARSPLVAEMVKLTQGEPFYLRFLAEDLARQESVENVPADLPADARDYIRRQVRGLDDATLVRHFPAELAGRHDSAIPVATLILRVLAAAKDWMTRDQLIDIVGRENRSLVKALLPALRRYMSADVGDVARYLVMPLRLREGILRAFEAEEILDAKERIARYCQDWAAHPSSFVFSYASEYLAELGHYDALVSLLGQSFLRAKAEAMRAPHMVQADLQIALQLAAERGDEAKVVRFLGMAARVRSAIEGRALRGGIAADAAEGEFDIAAAAARALVEPEMAVLQLLMVAETAICAGRADKGLQLVREALSIHTAPLHHAQTNIKPLIQRLVVDHDSLNLARALADRVQLSTDSLLAITARSVAGVMSALSLSLLLHIKDDWTAGDATVEVMRVMSKSDRAAAIAAWQALVKDRPDVAWALFYKALPIRRDLQGSEEIRRELDVRIRAALDSLQQVDPRHHRRKVEELNRAASALGQFDVQEALSFTLRECPEIADSAQTRTTTLTALLLMAARQGKVVDVATLAKIIEPARERQNMGAPYFEDEFLASVAVHFRLSGLNERAESLRAQVHDADCLHVLAAIEALAGRCVDAEALALHLNSCLWKENQLRTSRLVLARMLGERASADPGCIEPAIAAMQDPTARIGVLIALLNSGSDVRLSHVLSTLALKAVASIEPAADRSSAAIRLAKACPDPSGVPVAALLEAALPGFEMVLMSERGVHVLVDAMSLATAYGRQQIALAALRTIASRDADACSEALDDEGIELALECAIDTGLDMDLDTFNACMRSARHPLTAARLAARSRWARAHVGVRLQGHALDLDVLREELCGIGLMGIEAAEGPKDVRPDAIVWGKLWQDIVDAERTHTVDVPLLKLDRYKRSVLINLAIADLNAAIVACANVASWDRHLAMIDAAGALRPAMPGCRRAVEEAARAAQDVDSRNRPAACINVVCASHAIFGSVDRRVVEQAMKCLSAVEDPADGVVACLLALNSDLAAWPQEHIASIWLQIESQFPEVELNDPNVSQIFAACRNLEDAHIAERAWTAFANVILARDRPGWVYATSLAEMSYELATLGFPDKASQLVDLTDGYETPHEGWNPHIQAWRTCTLAVLHDQAARPTCLQFLADLRAAIEAGPVLNYTTSLSILASKYPGIATDNELRARIVNNADVVGDLEDRAEVLWDLMQALVSSNLIQQAAGLVARVPRGDYWDHCVTRVLAGLAEADLETSERARAWALLFDAVKDDAQALLRCAADRIGSYLHATPPQDRASARDQLEREIEAIEAISL